MAMTKGRTATVVGSMIGLCLISGLVGAAIAGKFDVTWGENFSVDFGQSISIILSALGAILTAIAILFAIFAIIGWATFSSQVDANVKEYIAEDFEKQGPLFQTVVADLLPKLEQSMFQGAEPPADELLDEENPEE